MISKRPETQHLRPLIPIWNFQSHSFVTTWWDRPRISWSVNPNITKINGPISIARNNFVSKLNYSDNFEVSFEYKASVVPRSEWQQILSGSLINFFSHTNFSGLEWTGLSELINQRSKLRRPVLLPISCSVCTIRVEGSR